MFSHIGEVIQHYREQKEMSIADFAVAAGIDSNSLIKIENHQQAISLEEIRGIAKALSVEVDTLFEKIGVSQGEELLSDLKRVDLLIDALHTQEELHKHNH